MKELRLTTRAPSSLTEQEVAAQFAIYAGRLAEFEPRDVVRGCRFVADSSTWWPSWHELATAVGEARVYREAAELRRLPPSTRTQEQREAELLATPEGQAALRHRIAAEWLSRHRKGQPCAVSILITERQNSEATLSKLDDGAISRALRDGWAARMAREAELAERHLAGPRAA